jgi:hypothetical protein
VAEGNTSAIPTEERKAVSQPLVAVNDIQCKVYYAFNCSDLWTDSGGNRLYINKSEPL